MDIANQKERQRLSNRYSALGYTNNIFQQKKGKYGLTSDARKFAKTKLIAGEDGLTPRGYVFNMATNSFAKDKDVFDKVGKKKKRRDKLKARFKKMGLKFNKEQRTLVPMPNVKPRVTGQIIVTFDRQYKNTTKREVSNPIPFTTDFKPNGAWKKDAETLIYNRFSDSNVEIIHIDIVRDKTYFFPGNKDTRIPLQHIRLRRIVLNIDGDQEHIWDKRAGRCVVDFLEWYYGETKIDKDLLTEENYDECFDDNWREEGISTVEIENFCKTLPTKMIALDEDYRVIRQYNPSSKQSLPVLLFRVKDNHIHPVIDKSKIKSVTNTYTQNELTRGTHKGMKEKMEEARKEKDSLPVVLIKGEDLEYQVDDVIKKYSREEYMCKMMLQYKVSVVGRNVDWGKMSLESFILDKTKYVFDDMDNQAVKDYIQAKGEVYKGQKASSYVAKALRENEVDTSKANTKVNEIYAHEHIKDITHEGGQLENYLDEEGEVDYDQLPEVITIDINKCHTNALMNPIEDFMYMDFESQLEDYVDIGDELLLGHYWVETKSTKLFCGNKFYPASIVKKGLEEGLITKENIKKQIIASRCQPKDYLHKVFNSYKEFADAGNDSILSEEEIQNLTPEELETYKKQQDEFRLTNREFTKLLNNTTSGVFGKTKYMSMNKWISTDIEQAFDYIAEHHEQDTFIRPIKLIDNDVEYEFWLYGTRHNQMKEFNNFPIYTQVLAQQSVMLYDAIKLATNNDWTRLLHRKSDAFTFIPYKDNYKQLVGDQIGQFKIAENPKKPRNKPYTNATIDWSKYQKGWEVYEPVKSSYDYEEYYKLIDEKKSLMTIGEAGSGKTYIINKISEKYNVLKLSFMNVASLRIGGQTIHKSFSYNVEDDKVLKSSLKSVMKEGYDAIIIDEQGTLTGNLWRILFEIKKHSDVPFFLFGDWWQLKNLDGVRYKNHQILKSLCDYNITHELEYHNKCRMERRLRMLLKPLRSDEEDQLERQQIACQFTQLKRIDDLPLTNIVYSNNYKHKLNKDMNKLHHKNHDFTTLPKSAEDLVNSKYSKLFHEKRPFYLFTPHKNMPIICIKNDRDIQEMKNGQRYTIIDWDTGSCDLTQGRRPEGRSQADAYKETEEYFPDWKFRIRVNHSGTIHEISLMKMLLEFDMAYAMTNHKIIGDTLTDFCIHQHLHPRVDNSWLYTALSRGTKMTDVKVCQSLYFLHK